MGTGAAKEQTTRVSTPLLGLAEPARAWSVVALLAAYYTATMCRDMWHLDSPEFALVARQLGLSHPPGQPTHTLLGFVFAHLPGVSPLFGLNLLSALCGALSALPVCAVGERLCGDAPASARKWLYPCIALLGLHAPLWEPATRIEVYPLATLCGLSGLAVLLHALDARPPAGRLFAVAGLLFGICASTNAFIGPAFALALCPHLLALGWQRRMRWRDLGTLCVAGLSGLLFYLYVPLSAGRPGILVWGDPAGAQALAAYFSGSDYRPMFPGLVLAPSPLVEGSRLLALQRWLGQTWDWLRWSWPLGVPPLLLLGLSGHIALGRASVGRLTVPLLFVISVATIAGNTVWRPDNPDYLGYLAGPLWLSGAGVAGWLVVLRSKGGRIVPSLLLGALVLLVLISPPGVLARTRHLDRFSRSLAQAVLQEAPKGAILLVEHDHYVAPLLYLTLAERKRPDVIVLATGLASSRWYWDLQYELHPDLAPFALRGSGGRVGRLQRFARRQPGRPVLTESPRWATALKLPPCLRGFLFATGSGCAPTRAPERGPTELRAKSAAQLGAGSPSTDQLLAHLALQRGLALVAEGHPWAALEAMLSGVTGPHPTPKAGPETGQAAPIALPLPQRWQRSALLGDPGRNLLAAGLLAGALGEPMAGDLVQAAAATGLPEATALLRQADSR